MTDELQYVFKVVIVGQSGVGKTSMLLRHVDLQFPEHHMATIGVEYKVKTHLIDGNSVKLQMWDTAGQERFQSLATHYFKGAHAAVFVFALDSTVSFSKLNYWINLTDEQKIGHKFLIGNKCDLERDVSQELIHGFLQQRPDISYIEVSAKTGQSIDEAFLKLATELLIKAKVQRQEVDKDLIRLGDDELHINECESRTGNKCCGGTG